MILLRSSWQTVNIGDVAHTPGALRILETHLPDAEIALWPVHVDNGVDEMLARAFPKVKIVQGRTGEDGKPTTSELQRAVDEADLLLHGSGPGVVAHKDLAAWRGLTGKPYGILGVTVNEVTERLRAPISEAEFIFCRDSISLDRIKAEGVTCPVMEFAPDAAFACDLTDDARAEAYMDSAGLAPGEFICVIPRLRYTPYHTFKQVNWPEERIRMVESVNAETREPDHAKLREVIIHWVRETGLKVLACPEMVHEMQVARELLVDPLPEDVKPRVVWREEFWRPDEASSVYARARAMVSFELHSPILACRMGTPAIHVRQPTDTCKGVMWRDVGLGDWLFEVEEVDGSEVARRVLDIHSDFEGAKRTLGDAMRFVNERHGRAMAEVRKSAGLG